MDNAQTKTNSVIWIKNIKTGPILVKDGCKLQNYKNKTQKQLRVIILIFWHMHGCILSPKTGATRDKNAQYKDIQFVWFKDLSFFHYFIFKKGKIGVWFNHATEIFFTSIDERRKFAPSDKLFILIKALETQAFHWQNLMQKSISVHTSVNNFAAYFSFTVAVYSRDGSKMRQRNSNKGCNNTCKQKSYIENSYRSIHQRQEICQPENITLPLLQN